MNNTEAEIEAEKTCHVQKLDEFLVSGKENLGASPVGLVEEDPTQSTQPGAG